MALRRIGNYLRLFCAIGWLTTCGLATASEYHGQVTFGGLPVPGAAITATQGDKKFVTSTDQDGVFSFPDLANGSWTIEVQMQGFSTIKDQIVIGPNAPAAPPWELKMLPLDEIKAETKTVAPAASAAAPETKTDQTKPQDKANQTRPQDNKPPLTAGPPDDTDQRAADGLLINGTQNNGAASPFAQLAAFGNSRPGRGGLYNGGISMILNTSVFDANQFSLGGQNTPKPAYNQITGGLTFGGPLRIPHVWKNGPNFVVAYQWMRNPVDSTASGVVPTTDEREGNLSQVPAQIYNPATGLPFAGNVVPVSTQAQALLNLYPMPNLTGNSRYNYQIPIITNTHQDALQSRFNKLLNRKDTISGVFGFQSTRMSAPNLFGWTDTTDSLGLNARVSWGHRFNQHLFQNLAFQYTRSATLATPYWENRENVSGEAGIAGNDQDPMNFGPPTLNFASSGVYPLSDGQSSHNRKQTSSLGDQMLWRHGLHNVQFGGDFRRQEFNYLSQQDPRGVFTFTGAATQENVGGVAVADTGSDLADFLLGIPDTSSIAFGNADKYFRQSGYDYYITDDWRIRPTLTINAGFRWEYGAPITELFGRLVNLDITPDFAAVAPVLGSNPVGPLTGQTYPTSLIRPDKRGYQPRIGIAWRPFSGSSVVVHAGYGITDDTSVYQTIAQQMAQQAPLSTSLTVSNSAACPLTLANGFNTCPSVTPDTYAIDPNFRIGYLQTWNLAVQRDLPGSLQLSVTYVGNKGTRGVQEFLPNTYPIGTTPNPCPTCPAGFTYLTSNGNSNRESGMVLLRRRLHNGLTASAQYTFSKSIDDDSLMGGQSSSSPTIAQNWLDLGGQRGLSTFDQRHLLNLTLQYTTGMGIGGKSLMSGWRGRLYKEWTILLPVTIGSGLPETPIYLASVPGTGITGTIRPDLTGAPIYANQLGLYLNPAAFTAPMSGQWGTAGRDSITGPPQFSFDASMVRTFRLHDRLNLDVQFMSTNILNHVTFTGWYATVQNNNNNNPLFGTPIAANQMRSVLTTLRLRF